MSHFRSQNARHIFNQAAQRYQKRYQDISAYQTGLQAFCEQIKTPKPHILEIACGPGNLPHFLLSERPDFQLLGIDLAEEMIGLAQRHNPSAQFRVMDARDIGTLEPIYHGIVCGFGLPYLSKEEAIALIFDAARLLKLRGTLYLSLMEGPYEKSGWIGDSDGGAARLYTYYHQADYLLAALAKAGFEHIDHSVREYRKKDDTLIKELIILAQKA